MLYFIVFKIPLMGVKNVFCFIVFLFISCRNVLSGVDIRALDTVCGQCLAKVSSHLLIAVE